MTARIIKKEDESLSDGPNRVPNIKFIMIDQAACHLASETGLTIRRLHN